MRALRCIVAAVTLSFTACGGTDQPVALGEPLVVEQGSFRHGKLPGLDSDGGLIGDAGNPVVTSLATSFGVVRPGTRGEVVSGRTSGDAYAVAMRILDEGSGYWVSSVAAEDPLFPGELTWSFSFDASSDIAPGIHELEVVAFDKTGRAGTKASTQLCIASELPDNLNVCNPKNLPPAAIASLTWNANADLDLTAVAPDGTTIGRSKRSLLSGTTALVQLDADGVTGCLADGRRMENISFNDGAPKGTWKLYANLFDACGFAGISYELTLYERQTNADGTFGLVEVSKVSGQFIRQQANGGNGPALFLTDVQFQ